MCKINKNIIVFYYINLHTDLWTQTKGELCIYSSSQQTACMTDLHSATFFDRDKTETEAGVQRITGGKKSLKASSKSFGSLKKNPAQIEA